MTCRYLIRIDGINYIRYLYFRNLLCTIEIEDKFIFYFIKKNVHSYDIMGFFYKSKMIYYRENIRSIKEIDLYFRDLIKRELNIDVQIY